MTKATRSYRRFYGALNAIAASGERDEMKKMLVRQYTHGRTDSLREMSDDEYGRCCRALEEHGRDGERLRRERSATLKLMQQMGVDTTDWGRVNLLCRHPRIAGRDFYTIDEAGHRELRRKLRAISGKGGLRGGEGKPEKAVLVIPPQMPQA